MSVEVKELKGLALPTGGDAITLLPIDFELSANSREVSDQPRHLD